MICKRCVIDTKTSGVTLDADGVCNLCHQHDELSAAHPIGGFDRIAKTIGKRVVVGLSGGLDSSYTLYLMKEKYGLDPIAVTFDNGWGTKTATSNIEAMTESLGVPHHVVSTNYEASDDIMRAFIRAGLPDVEAVTDISFVAGLYQAAELFGVKSIILGSSFRTEGITPHGMFYFDAKYVDDVHRRHGNDPGLQVPMLWLRPWMKWIMVDRIKRYTPLYYMDYVKDEAKEFLSSNFDWKWYDGHHRENIMTEWNNNMWLYNKFSTDLREVEYSSLIRSCQLDRDTALAKLSSPPAIGIDTNSVVCSRLGISPYDMLEYMLAPPGRRSKYASYKPTFRKMRPFFWAAAKANLVPMSFYKKYCFG